MADIKQLVEAMGDLDEDLVNDILAEVMADGGAQAQAAMDACQEGLGIVGTRFEEKEYFVGDLIYAGDIMTGAVGILKDALVSGDGAKAGKIILCTVHGDLYDIGKNIVRAFLEASGFEVLDLGIDTPVAKVVETAKAEGIKIIALSGVLTLAIDAMKDTIDGFAAAGMRDDVKIIIGGNCVNADVCASIGADEWAYSPQKTVNVCKAWANG